MKLQIGSHFNQGSTMKHQGLIPTLFLFLLLGFEGSFAYQSSEELQEVGGPEPELPQELPQNVEELLYYIGNFNVGQDFSKHYFVQYSRKSFYQCHNFCSQLRNWQSNGDWKRLEMLSFESLTEHFEMITKFKNDTHYESAKYWSYWTSLNSLPNLVGLKSRPILPREEWVWGSTGKPMEFISVWGQNSPQRDRLSSGNTQEFQSCVALEPLEGFRDRMCSDLYFACVCQVTLKNEGGSVPLPNIGRGEKSSCGSGDENGKFKKTRSFAKLTEL